MGHIPLRGVTGQVVLFHCENEGRYPIKLKAANEI
ncbi:hypothetical protein BLAT2472_30362 [Burkholderia latens]